MTHRDDAIREAMRQRNIREGNRQGWRLVAFIFALVFVPPILAGIFK